MVKKELALVLNSPGGEALPAERIVNICRSFSPNGYTVIVPKMAKSAATMICFGAKEIGMGRTSELGPVDPQILVESKDSMKYYAAHEIIESYEELMKKANRTKQKADPYLQQLYRFDARDIRRIRSAQQLSESIAVTVLRGGVFRGRTLRQIKNKIKPFS
jgi:ClpP class serine protease